MSNQPKTTPLFSGTPVPEPLQKFVEAAVKLVNDGRADHARKMTRYTDRVNSEADGGLYSTVIDYAEQIFATGYTWECVQSVEFWLHNDDSLERFIGHVMLYADKLSDDLLQLVDFPDTTGWSAVKKGIQMRVKRNMVRDLRELLALLPANA